MVHVVSAGSGSRADGRFGMAAVSAGRSEMRHRSGVESYTHCKAMKDSNSSSERNENRALVVFLNGDSVSVQHHVGDREKTGHLSAAAVWCPTHRVTWKALPHMKSATGQRP